MLIEMIRSLFYCSDEQGVNDFALELSSQKRLSVLGSGELLHHLFTAIRTFSPYAPLKSSAQYTSRKVFQFDA
jgi:hypothetical protein